MNHILPGEGARRERELHGRLEHGSPVVPATREAALVHAIDELSGRLGAFDRLAKESPEAIDQIRQVIEQRRGAQ